MSEMKWWGWGQPGLRFGLEGRPKLIDYIKNYFGVEKVQSRDDWKAGQVSLPSSKISEAEVEDLRGILGAGKVSDGHEDRLVHALGKSYQDLIRARDNKILLAPDVVLFPESEEDLIKIFTWAKSRDAAIVPFAGGSSVVGGLESRRGAKALTISVNMRRMNKILAVDDISMTARVQAGILGPELEEELSHRGYVLGHFPQSFEFSTLGGWIAAKSSGQNSMMYGGIERLVSSLKIIGPEGYFETLGVPRHAAGPDFNHLVIGSEGTLGIISEATVRLSPLPKQKDYYMFVVKSFSQGAEAAREIIQSGLNLAMVRVSDEGESKASLVMSSGHGTWLSRWLTRIVKFYFKSKGLPLTEPVCLVLVGFEGDRKRFCSTLRQVKTIFAKRRGLCLGKGAGKRWLKDRFFLPYLRDDLMDCGLFVETLETSARWAQLGTVYQAVKSALEKACEDEKARAQVFCHISHLYKDGASLYYTIIAQQNTKDLIGQWERIKKAANETIKAHGAAISHHHGVGVDQRKYIHWSPTERELFLKMKGVMDPQGLMNPEKLL